MKYINIWFLFATVEVLRIGLRDSGLHIFRYLYQLWRRPFDASFAAKIGELLLENLRLLPSWIRNVTKKRDDTVGIL